MLAKQLSSMARGGIEGGVPKTNARKIEMWDAKMWWREAERTMRSERARSRCPCLLCLFGKPLLRRTHALHLWNYGRHPMKRLQPQVRSMLAVEV